MISRRLNRVLVLVGVSLILFSASALVLGQAPGREIALNFTLYEDNPVLSRGPVGAWDARVIWLGCVLHHADQFHMFYAGGAQTSAPYAIGYAYSDDGLHWTKHPDNPVLVADETLFRFGLYGGPCRVDDDGEWLMYVQPRAGSSYQPAHAVLRASAPGPAGPWTLGHEVMATMRGTWDYGMTPNTILETPDETILYYSAYSMLDGSLSGIGRATSPDGLRFTRHDNPETQGSALLPIAFYGTDPVFVGDPEGWDATVYGAFVQPVEDGWEMFYSAYGPGWKTPVHIGYALSEDGINWVRRGESLELGSFDTSLWMPYVVVVEDTYYLYSMTEPFEPWMQEIAVATGTVTRQ